MQTQLEQYRATESPERSPRHRRRAPLIIVIVVLGLIIGIIVAILNWPFTRQAVIASLQQQSGSSVQIGQFHLFYLPHPGCVAEDVVFVRARGTQPLITVNKLTIIGSYHGLLTHHLTKVRAEGIHVFIRRGEPGNGSSGPYNVGSSGSRITIGVIVADGAQVELTPEKPGEKPMIFNVPKLVVHDLADGHALQYRAVVDLPMPAAEIQVEGKFGPWRAGHGGESKMSGSYDVKRLALAAFGGVAGTVSSNGSFDGVLQSVKVQGSAQIPDFIVRQSKHVVPVTAEYEARVQGMTGDVNVDAVRAHFGKTTVIGAGSISGDGTAKTAIFNIASGRARIQDLLWMFVSDSPPAMAGAITFRGKATLPPGSQPFLERLRMQGDFGINAGQYPDKQIQKTIDVLSARARGEAGKVQQVDNQLGKDSYDPGKVLSNVKGHVAMTDATAHLDNVTFDVPGASARMSGTYNVETERINLSGPMHMVATLSQATTGVRSALMKVIQPFMHKSKKKESVVMVHIGGTYDNPTYTATPRAER